MTRIQVTQIIATTAIAAGTMFALAGPASAQPPKCELATVASKVCPNPGRAGQFDGNDTRPPSEVPGSNGWGYGYNAETNEMEWGRQDD